MMAASLEPTTFVCPALDQGCCIARVVDSHLVAGQPFAFY